MGRNEQTATMTDDEKAVSKESVQNINTHIVEK